MAGNGKGMREKASTEPLTEFDGIRPRVDLLSRRLHSFHIQSLLKLAPFDRGKLKI